MVLSLVIFTGCNREKQKDENYLSIKDITYTSAVLEKNSNIYIYDKSSSYLEPVGELSRFKELTALSDDSKNIAFKYVDDQFRINIYNLESKEYRTLEIEDSGEISDIQWYGDLLAVGIYENPTTNKYLIYDSKSFELINSCKGILVDVLDEGKTLIYGVNTQGVTSIYINDHKVYTLEKTGEVLLGGKVSSDKKEISFLTFAFNQGTLESKEYLYIGKLKNGNMDDLKILEKPYEIYGEIKYDGGNLVILNQDDYTEVVDDEFTTKDLSEVNSSIKENTNKLKGILKDTFKSEAVDLNMSWTELGVKNITWFIR